ncbi:MAG: type II toxin-antitoxin system RatA family toxin [Gammaproteobacteria bacterium]|nr:type II toxin-antitoxin system RatA family toxin [Gammaproteobacteria bacterium]MDE0442386.1 type II toxin-antitoxin system RatA family toxin [Gammaproteobacteria bacterium]
MPSIERSALIAFPAADVYALVNDIEQYPMFLPWCSQTEVVSRSETEVVARIDIAVRGRRETLVTRNRLTPTTAIDLEMIEGPFRRFEGRWLLTPLGEAGCRVDLGVSFELANRLIGVFAAPFLHRIADRVVDAFAARARDVLG